LDEGPVAISGHDTADPVPLTPLRPDVAIDGSRRYK